MQTATRVKQRQRCDEINFTRMGGRGGYHSASGAEMGDNCTQAACIACTSSQTAEGRGEGRGREAGGGGGGGRVPDAR